MINIPTQLLDEIKVLDCGSLFYSSSTGELESKYINGFNGSFEKIELQDNELSAAGTISFIVSGTNEILGTILMNTLFGYKSSYPFVYPWNNISSGSPLITVKPVFQGGTIYISGPLSSFVYEGYIQNIRIYYR